MQLRNFRWGNHFIEVNKGKDLYVSVHSGSRHLGYEVAEYYQKLAYQKCKEKGVHIAYEDAYLVGKEFQKYIDDIQMVQEYASLNRIIILKIISKEMKWKIVDTIETIHNYIEIVETPILRKGAISAKAKEKVVIPIHMQQGILLCEGKGIEEMNASAPHGAGRIYSREEVKNRYTVSQFKKEIKNIYYSVVSKEVLDGSPFAYRSLKDIQNLIEETVTIKEILPPIYNYKDQGKC